MVQAFRIWATGYSARNDDLELVNVLKSVLEHRPIFLLHDFRSDYDLVVWSNTKINTIKCRMMNLAKR